MPFTALALLLPALALAGPLERLSALIPQGLSEGVTRTGAPCRVAFESALHPRTGLTTYVRALVAGEPTGELLDAEAFAAPARPPRGRRTKLHPSRAATITASIARSGRIWVRITDRARRAEAACLLYTP